MDDRKLRKQYFVYLVSAVLFTVTFSVAFVVHRYSSEMGDTIDKLRALSGGSVKVKRATQSAHDSIARIRKEIPADYLSRPVENVIFQTVDAIRERAKDADVIVESLQDGGDRMEMPIVLKGPLGDYTEFLRLLHFLESLRFPFFSTTELIITRETDKSPSYELRGSITTFKTSATPDRQSKSAPRRRS